MQHRREIDGLRAVAVLPVILFHAGFQMFSGGFVGVDIFFVISGYLITSILIEELAAGKLSILRFYERRARRILPALFTVMAACIPFAWFMMLPNRFKDFSESLIAVVFFGSNILFWRESGYFEPAVDLKPLLHTWSLAVEEQFYLLFPLLLLVLWRFGRTTSVGVIVTIAVVSLLISEVGWRYAQTANFYLAPSRAWELLAGSICAFVLTGRAQRTSNLLSLVGLALILGSVFVYDERTPFPSLYALAPVGGTVLIVLFAGNGTWVARLLSTPILVGIGLISYSAYLWHQPIFAFARIGGVDPGDGLVMGGLALASFGLAWVTWAFVEQPFRNRARPLLPARRQVFAASAAVGLVFVGIGIAGHLTDGFAGRLTATERAVLRYADYPADVPYRKRSCMLMLDQGVGDVDPNCWRGARQLLIGDSHAAGFAAGLRDHPEIGVLTAASCPPVMDFAIFRLPGCDGINAFRLDLIDDMRPDVVYMLAAWTEYWYRPDYQRQFARMLDRVVASGAQVVVIGGLPRFTPNLPEMVLKQGTPLQPGAEVRTDLAEVRRIDDDLRRMAKAHGARFHDMLADLCPAGDACLAVVPRQTDDFDPLGGPALFAFDLAHPTASGAAVLVQRFFARQAE